MANKTKNIKTLFAKNDYDKFDLIFTFSKKLLELSDKFVLLPYGGCWIEGSDRKIHSKTKDISIILSAKKSTMGHKLRHSVLEKFKNIDSFGYDFYSDENYEPSDLASEINHKGNE